MSKYNINHYFMKDNKYLGDCLTLTIDLKEVKNTENGITGDYLLIFIKFGKKINHKSKTLNYLELINKENFCPERPILLRIASECIFGVFGDSHCDCETQRLNSLKAIKTNGQGVYIHIPQEGQGQGLLYKANELNLQVRGRDQAGRFTGFMSLKEASEYIINQSNPDIRKWGFLREILKSLNLTDLEYTLISSNLDKITTFKNLLNLKINSIFDVTRDINTEYVGEYLSKLEMKKVSLSNKEIKKISEVLEEKTLLPERAKKIIKRVYEKELNNSKANTKYVKIFKKFYEQIH